MAGLPELLTSLTGHMAVGPSPLLILLCGTYLALRRFMDWRIPVAVLGSAGLTAGCCSPSTRYVSRIPSSCCSPAA